MYRYTFIYLRMHTDAALLRTHFKIGSDRFGCSPTHIDVRCWSLSFFRIFPCRGEYCRRCDQGNLWGFFFLFIIIFVSLLIQVFFLCLFPFLSTCCLVRNKKGFIFSLGRYVANVNSCTVFLLFSRFLDVSLWAIGYESCSIRRKKNTNGIH